MQKIALLLILVSNFIPCKWPSQNLHHKRRGRLIFGHYVYFDGIYTYLIEISRWKVIRLCYDLQKVIFAQKSNFGHYFALPHACFKRTVARSHRNARQERGKCGKWSFSYCCCQKSMNSPRLPRSWRAASITLSETPCAQDNLSKCRHPSNLC